MKKLKLTICSALILNTSWCFAATLNSMPQDLISQAFVGKTMITITSILGDNNQSLVNKLTFYIDTQGKIFGKLDTPVTNSPQNDQGSYAIKTDGSLCMTWQHWNNGQEWCANIFETANSYLFVDTNNNFHTAVMKNNISSGNQV